MSKFTLWYESAHFELFPALLITYDTIFIKVLSTANRKCYKFQTYQCCSKKNNISSNLLKGCQSICLSIWWFWSIYSKISDLCAMSSKSEGRSKHTHTHVITVIIIDNNKSNEFISIDSATIVIMRLSIFNIGLTLTHNITVSCNSFNLSLITLLITVIDSQLKYRKHVQRERERERTSKPQQTSDKRQATNVKYNNNSNIIKNNA